MRDNLPNEADKLLNNPAFEEALERLTREILRKIERTEFDGSEDQERYREKLNLLLHCKGRFVSILKQMVATGELKERRLEKKTLVNRSGL